MCLFDSLIETFQILQNLYRMVHFIYFFEENLVRALTLWEIFRFMCFSTVQLNIHSYVFLIFYNYLFYIYIHVIILCFVLFIPFFSIQRLKIIPLYDQMFAVKADVEPQKFILLLKSTVTEYIKRRGCSLHTSEMDLITSHILSPN